MIRRLVFAAIVLGAIASGSVVATPIAAASGPYANCTAAHKDGRYNIPKADPDYAPKLDRDGDGIACEG